MTEALKIEITNWVKKVLPEYIRDCSTADYEPDEYKNYLVEDAQYEFASGEDRIPSFKNHE